MQETEIEIEEKIQRSATLQPSGKKNSWQIFDRIAPRYDFLNRLLSFRRDVAWRNKLSDYLPQGEALRVLDLATGTADVLLSLFSTSRRVKSGVGIDRSEKMLEIGRAKIRQRGLQDAILLVNADATGIPFPPESFHAVTMAFGIRNVADVPAALEELFRVLKPDGRALILEFSLPENALFRKLYLFYFRHILPLLGGIISGDYPAYRYLNRTVETFPYGQHFCELLENAGFLNVGYHPLSQGIATIYQGDKI